jgi:hypothetical protein
MFRQLFPIAAVALCARISSAQAPECWIADSTDDAIYRCRDLTADGDYNDAGEIVAVYQAALGAEPLQLPVGIARGVDGTLGVSDGGEDSIFLLRDFSGDGDALDPGEFWRFFDGRVGGNASNLLLNSANSLYYEGAAETWWTINNTGTDGILALKDLDGDGDANDAGESLLFWTAPAGGASDYQPQAVWVEANPVPQFPPLGARAWYVDIGTTGVIQKGVYRVFDLNGDGDGDDAGEWAPYFIPPAPATPFLWSLSRAADGWFYTADTGNERVWRFRDGNGDGDAQDPGESVVWWQVSGTSNIWDTWAAADGSLHLIESQAPDRIQRLFDADMNGSISAAEISNLYDETLSALVFGNPRGIDGAPAAAAGTGFCFGDGTAAACPCGNSGAQGRGCANSLNPDGARLETAGRASVAQDSLELIGRFMPNAPSLYFQGAIPVLGGQGSPFGDGLRCAGGMTVRLGERTNVNGSSSYPGGASPLISVSGMVAPSDTRVYQVWYRNAAAFCTSDTWNLSNAVSVTWGT